MVAIPDDASEPLPHLLQLLDAEPAQRCLGIGDRRGYRLLDFMGDRGRELGPMVVTRLACASSIWNRRSLSRASASAAPRAAAAAATAQKAKPTSPRPPRSANAPARSSCDLAAAAAAAVAPVNASAVARISSIMALPRPVCTTANAPATSPERRRAMVSASSAIFASDSVRMRASAADGPSSGPTSMPASAPGRRARAAW